MSENHATVWPSTQEVGNMLVDAKAIAEIEFNLDHRFTEDAETKMLVCRQHRLVSLSSDEIRELCRELNAATLPIREKWNSDLVLKSANVLKQYL